MFLFRTNSILFIVSPSKRQEAFMMTLYYLRQPQQTHLELSRGTISKLKPPGLKAMNLSDLTNKWLTNNKNKF